MSFEIQNVSGRFYLSGGSGLSHFPSCSASGPQAIAVVWGPPYWGLSFPGLQGTWRLGRAEEQAESVLLSRVLISTSWAGPGLLPPCQPLMVTSSQELPLPCAEVLSGVCLYCSPARSPKCNSWHPDLILLGAFSSSLSPHHHLPIRSGTLAARADGIKLAVCQIPLIQKLGFPYLHSSPPSGSPEPTSPGLYPLPTSNTALLQPNNPKYVQVKCPPRR
jgi:hypothetical protein